MRRSLVHRLALLSLASAVFSLGCTNEDIVYRGGVNYAAPPAKAAGFIGYADSLSQRPVCGSCHAEMLARWASTKHAAAWSDLQASGHASSSCEGCHSVGANGNASTDTLGGFASVKNYRYKDVQCESCHGPGLDHAALPGPTNRQLASIQADTGRKDGCGECHTGTHDPFVDEWRRSGHAVTNATAHECTDPSCPACHTAQGALLAMGSSTNYKEKAAVQPDMQSITGAVCHDSHGSPNPKQLRMPISSNSVDNNLCMKCHQRRGTVVEITTRNSTHSPEGPTLLGTAGWYPPGVSTEPVVRPHGNPDINSKLCAGCPGPRYTVTDATTGLFAFQSTGHRFLATPCVDANGQPTDDQSCATTAKTYRSCVASSCHSSEANALDRFVNGTARILVLTNEVTRLTNLIKAGPRKAECTFPYVGGYTSCLGANFNLSLATKTGAAAHNEFLLEKLLNTSINQMKADYGLTGLLWAPTEQAPAQLRSPR